jgi:hypothetical protein
MRRSRTIERESRPIRGIRCASDAMQSDLRGGNRRLRGHKAVTGCRTIAPSPQPLDDRGGFLRVDGDQLHKRIRSPLARVPENGASHCPNVGRLSGEARCETAGHVSIWWRMASARSVVVGASAAGSDLGQSGMTYREKLPRG